MAPGSLPLASSACIDPRVKEHLGIAVDGEIILVFDRGLPYIKIRRIADRIPGSQIRKIKVLTTYTVLEDNEYYDTKASIA